MFARVSIVEERDQYDRAVGAESNEKELTVFRSLESTLFSVESSPFRVGLVEHLDPKLGAFVLSEARKHQYHINELGKRKIDQLRRLTCH